MSGNPWIMSRPHNTWTTASEVVEDIKVTSSHLEYASNTIVKVHGTGLRGQYAPSTRVLQGSPNHWPEPLGVLAVIPGMPGRTRPMLWWPHPFLATRHHHEPVTGLQFHFDDAQVAYMQSIEDTLLQLLWDHKLILSYQAALMSRTRPLDPSTVILDWTFGYSVLEFFVGFVPINLCILETLVRFRLSSECQCVYLIHSFLVILKRNFVEAFIID